MTAKSKKAKQEVTIVAPKITTAWIKVYEVSNKSEVEITNAILALYGAISNSQLSRNDARKVCKDTNKEGSVLKFSHIEGLDTWANMRAKFAEFCELPIANQLSQATAAYKLLGIGNAEKMPSLEVVKDEVKTARKNKNSKKSSPKTPKSKTTNKDVFTEFFNFLNTLSAENLTDSEIDLLSQISVRLIELEPISA